MCSTDQCNPAECNGQTGQCEAEVIECDDGSECTDDAFVCSNGTASCVYTSNGLCNDNIL